MKNTTNDKDSLFNSANYYKWIEPRSYYVHYYNNFDMAFHKHSRIEIMYVVMGEMMVQFMQENNPEPVTYLLRPNEYIFIDANVTHKIRVNNINTRIYNLEFSVSEHNNGDFTLYSLFEKESFARQFFTSNQQIMRQRDNGVMLHELMLIQRYIGNNINSPSDTCLNYMLYVMLLILAKQYASTNKHIYGITYINKATNYIYDNYNLEISLTEMAEYCNISANYLNQLFKKNFGMTVIAYLNNYRIERTVFLLENTDLSIDQIREQTGFNNKTNFNLNFKKIVGMSPREYRNEFKRLNKVAAHDKGKTNKYIY